MIQGRPTSSDTSENSSGDEDYGCVANDLRLYPRLPEPRMSSLSGIQEVITSPVSQRDAIAGLVLSDNYLDKLFDVFDQCEDLIDTESLHKMFQIFKSIGVPQNATVALFR